LPLSREEREELYDQYKKLDACGNPAGIDFHHIDLWDEFALYHPVRFLFVDALLLIKKAMSGISQVIRSRFKFPPQHK